MRHLVRDEEQVPILMIAQQRLIHRWPRVHEDAVRGKRRGRPVGVIHAVRDDDIHYAARRRKFGGEPRVGQFCVGQGSAREGFQLRREMHAQARRRERTPREIGPHLCASRRHAGGEQQREREQVVTHERNVHDRGRPAAPVGMASGLAPLRCRLYIRQSVCPSARSL